MQRSQNVNAGVRMSEDTKYKILNIKACLMCFGLVKVKSTQTIVSICDLAATSAIKAENVPIRVLKATARTESGEAVYDKLQTWPWATNIKGKYIWLPTETTTLDLATKQRSLRIVNFDVGCFQLNYILHGAYFSFLEHTFNPYQNALRATKFLKVLHAKLGGWDQSFAAYNSRNKKISQPYLLRSHSILASLEKSIVSNSTSEVHHRPLNGKARISRQVSLLPETRHKPHDLFASCEALG